MADRITESTTWDPRLYEQKHSFVWKYGEDLLALLAPRAGERILDLGCGTGHLTAKIAESGATVVGIDRSPEMIAEAARLYAEIPFRRADARTFSMDEPFDAVFSNAVLHWIPEPAEVIERVWEALRPGGRFVAEFGGHGNIRALMAGLFEALRECGVHEPERLSPWYYPTVGEYATLLERQGFRVTLAAHFDRFTPLDGEDGMRRWLDQFTSAFQAAVELGRRADLLSRVEEILRPELYRDGVWYVDYRRLRISAVRGM